MKPVFLFLFLFVLPPMPVIEWDLTPQQLSKQLKEGIQLSQLHEEGYWLEYDATGQKLPETFGADILIRLRKGPQNCVLEGDYHRLIKDTKAIWKCGGSGHMIQREGHFAFRLEQPCPDIPASYIPGGDQFIPGGDQFIPGGDQFIPGGDQFSGTDACYFLDISFSSKYRIAPVLLPLQVN